MEKRQIPFEVILNDVVIQFEECIESYVNGDDSSLEHILNVCMRRLNGRNYNKEHVTRKLLREIIKVYFKRSISYGKMKYSLIKEFGLSKSIRDEEILGAIKKRV